MVPRKTGGNHISQESLKQSVHGNVAEWVQGMETRGPYTEGANHGAPVWPLRSAFVMSQTPSRLLLENPDALIGFSPSVRSA